MAAAAIELSHGRPERAGRLLGIATALRGWDDTGDVGSRMIGQRTKDALSGSRYAAEHATGAATPRAQAVELVSTLISMPGTGQAPQPV